MGDLRLEVRARAWQWNREKFGVPALAGTAWRRNSEFIFIGGGVLS